jgi:hypothetical protein
VFENTFAIRADEVETLHERDFVALSNSLLRHDARRLGIPQEDVLTTLRITDADGGIDALTRGTDRASTYVPGGETVWQFKVSFPDSLPELTKALVRSEPAQAAFRRRAGYTLMVGEGMTASLFDRRMASLSEALRGCGCTGPVRLLNADHVADWASRVPAARLSLRPELAEFVRADLILNDARHAVAFQPDPARDEVIGALSEVLVGPDVISWHARVQGPAGVGKTRLVLETLKALGILEVALYCSGVSSRSLLSRAVQEGLEICLVVDECDASEADGLELLARASNGTVRLVTIGTGTGGGELTYALAPLGEDAMNDLLLRAVPGLTGEQRQWIAEKTGGYVKLAVAVAAGVVKGQVTIEDLRSSRDVRDIVAKLVVADEATRIAMTGVALLARMGRQGEVEEEGRVIAAFLGLDWGRMQSLLTQPIGDGLVVPKGRYVYVSPELLAMWLAAEFWEVHAHRIPDLMAALPATAVDSLVQRLAGLAGVPGVQAVLQEVVGSDGPFDGLEKLNDSRASKAFFTLAQAVPEVAMATLSDVILGTSTESLRGFDRGRRYVVWTLEWLAARANTFGPATAVLRRLALAETENYSNNATGVLTGLFLTVLAPTETPFEERIPVLRDMLSRERSEEERLLGVAAVDRALEVSEIGHPISFAEVLPPTHWRPRTWKEVRDLKRKVLEELDDLLDDSSVEVRRAAREALLSNSRGLVRLGLAEEVVTRMAALRVDTREEELRIWTASARILRYEGNVLNPEQTAALQRLQKRFFGDSLEDRIRRYTGPFSITEWREDPQERPDAKASALADEAMREKQVILAMAAWLASNEAQQVWPFGYRLGVLDEGRELFEAFRKAASQGANPRVLSAYLNGRADAGDVDWVDALLDEWAVAPATATLAFDASVTGAGTDRAVTRMLHAVGAELVDARWLAWTRFGRWSEGLSMEATRALISTLLNTGDVQCAEAALSILHSRLQHAPQDEAVRSLAREVLAHKATWQQETMVAWYWGEIGKAIVRDDPVGIADMVASTYLEGEASYHDSRLDVLRSALSVATLDVLSQLASRLKSSDAPYKLIWELEDANMLADVPLESVASIIEAGGVEVAAIVAQSFKPEPGRGDPLLRKLLNEYYEAVASTLAANFMSGGWTGPESAMIADKLAQVEMWMMEEEPALRRWARALQDSLKRQLVRARLEEEEDGR